MACLVRRCLLKDIATAPCRGIVNDWRYAVVRSDGSRRDGRSTLHSGLRTKCAGRKLTATGYGAQKQQCDDTEAEHDKPQRAQSESLSERLPPARAIGSYYAVGSQFNPQSTIHQANSDRRIAINVEQMPCHWRNERRISRSGLQLVGYAEFGLKRPRSGVRAESGPPAYADQLSEVRNSNSRVVSPALPGALASCA